GGGWKAFQSDRQTLSLEAAAGYLHERDKDGDNSADYPAASAMMDHDLQVGSAGGRTSTELEYLHRVDAPGGLVRGRLTASAPFFSSKVRLNLSYSVTHDTSESPLFDPSQDDDLKTQYAPTVTSLTAGVQIRWR
ncbi:MAG: DUF481 domain-containing protein, partial [Longimicrobiales bacterium]